MFRDKFLQLTETLNDLSISCEHLSIQYTSKISTLEVTVTQQAIQIKELQRQLKNQQRQRQDGIFIEGEPEPHPYTNPVRDISAGGGKVKK